VKYGNKKWGGLVCTVCRKKKKYVINEQLIAIEEEFKEINLRDRHTGWYRSIIRRQTSNRPV